MTPVGSYGAARVEQRAGSLWKSGLVSALHALAIAPAGFRESRALLG